MRDDVSCFRLGVRAKLVEGLRGLTHMPTGAPTFLVHRAYRLTMVGGPALEVFRALAAVRGRWVEDCERFGVAIDIWTDGSDGGLLHDRWHIASARLMLGFPKNREATVAGETFWT